MDRDFSRGEHTYSMRKSAATHTHTANHARTHTQLAWKVLCSKNVIGPQKGYLYCAVAADGDVSKQVLIDAAIQTARLARVQRVRFMSAT